MPPPRWMKRLGWGIVLAVAIAAALVVWDWGRRDEVSIASASVNGRTLMLWLNACNLSDYEHDVEEDATSVTVTVTARGGPSQDDCSDGDTVQLAEPLGDRELVDGSNGKRIPIDP